VAQWDWFCCTTGSCDVGTTSPRNAHRRSRARLSVYFSLRLSGGFNLHLKWRVIRPYADDTDTTTTVTVSIVKRTLYPVKMAGMLAPTLSSYFLFLNIYFFQQVVYIRRRLSRFVLDATRTERYPSCTLNPMCPSRGFLEVIEVTIRQSWARCVQLYEAHAS